MEEDLDQMDLQFFEKKILSFAQQFQFEIQSQEQTEYGVDQISAIGDGQTNDNCSEI